MDRDFGASFGLILSWWFGEKTNEKLSRSTVFAGFGSIRLEKGVQIIFLNIVLTKYETTLK